MRFSSKIATISTSATLAINAKVLDLKAKGIPIVSLAVGEPNFSTPAHICDAGEKAIRDGFTHYTTVTGIPELREAIAGYFHKIYGINPSPNNTIVTNGGKQSLYNLMLALLDPGDEVLIPSPYWVSYPDMARLCMGVPVFVRAAAEQNFKVTVEQLESARTEKSRILILNSPSNPTGACYSQQEIDSIAAWALQNNIFVISDEIYDQLIYDSDSPAGMAKWFEQYPDNFAIVNGLSKSFAMTGWRIGYTLTGEKLVKVLNQIMGQMTGNICTITQKAAVAALEGSYDCVHAMRDAFHKRRDICWKEVSSWENVYCPKPSGAFYLFADISGLFNESIPNSTALCSMLLDKAGVALVPGNGFGDPNCVRFSYAVADDVLVESLGKIRTAIYG